MAGFKEGFNPRLLFLGNASNIGYRYCGWTRELGIDADLYPLDSNALRSDIATFVGEAPTGDWILPIADIGDPLSFALRRNHVHALIEARYDLVVATGRSGLIASRLIKLPKVLNVNGSEVGGLPYTHLRRDRRGLRKISRGLVQAQLARSALRRMSLIFDNYLPNLLVLRRLGLAHLVIPGLGAEDCAHNRRLVNAPLLERLTDRYRDAKRVFLWLSRLNFSRPADRQYKGSERFVQALASMRAQLERGQIRVVVGRHGEEVDAFMQLPEVKRLSSQIDWVDHLDYSDLLTYLSIPNAVLFSVFGERQRDFGGIDRDAATVGTVTVSSATDEFMGRIYGASAPILHAVTASQIAGRMKQVLEMDDVTFNELQSEMAAFGLEYVDYSVIIPKMLDYFRTLLDSRQEARASTSSA